MTTSPYIITQRVHYALNGKDLMYIPTTSPQLRKTRDIILFPNIQSSLYTYLHLYLFTSIYKNLSSSVLQRNALYRGHPTNFHNSPCNDVQLTTVRTLQGGVTVNQIHTSRLADNLEKALLGGHGKARRTVIYIQSWSFTIIYFQSHSLYTFMYLQSSSFTLIYLHIP